ncbi:MAG: phage portal protein [Desulfobacterium sp.]|nr:phage portal protein [Desulfobacterium sp.]
MAVKWKFWQKKPVKKRYAAGRRGPNGGGWVPVGGKSINDLIATATPTVREKVRGLVRNFPYFARANNVLAGYVVGEGIQFQSRVTSSDGKFDKKSIQKIEDSARFWMDEADIAGKLHYYEMMELAKRQDGENGEFLLVKRISKKKNRYIPYCLQMIEPDWLTSDSTPKIKGNLIEQGVEFDSGTGEPLFYHFTDPDEWGKPAVVPAENVIHKFKTMRPGQLRGISPFVSGVLVAEDLSEYMDTEIDAAKMAAKYLGFVRTPDIAGRQNALEDADDEGEGKIEDLESAIMEYLRPGEEITLASNPRPGANFPPFVRLVLTMLSISTGVPYELLSGDYQGVNYSVGKMIRVDFAQFLRPEWTRHIRHFCQPTINPFFEYAVMSGKLDLSGFQSNSAHYMRSVWQPPGMESIDPGRETKARIDAIDYSLMSEIEDAKKRGRDYEDIVKEKAMAAKIREDHGVEIQKNSTALANNPAAVEKQDEE